MLTFLLTTILLKADQMLVCPQNDQTVKPNLNSDCFPSVPFTDPAAFDAYKTDPLNTSVLYAGTWSHVDGNSDFEDFYDRIHYTNYRWTYLVPHYYSTFIFCQFSFRRMPIRRSHFESDNKFVTYKPIENKS